MCLQVSRDYPCIMSGSLADAEELARTIGCKYAIFSLKDMQATNIVARSSIRQTSAKQFDMATVRTPLGDVLLSKEDYVIAITDADKAKFHVKQVMSDLIDAMCRAYGVVMVAVLIENETESV